MILQVVHDGTAVGGKPRASGDDPNLDFDKGKYSL